MEDQSRKNLIIINASTYNTNNATSLSHSLNNFMMREASYDHLRHRMNMAYTESPIQIRPISIEQQKHLHETLKIHARVAYYANELSKITQTQSIRSILSIPHLSFSMPGKTQAPSLHNTLLQNAVNESLYVLYKSDGSLKPSLSTDDQYHMARITTNYLKKEIPDNYKDFLEAFNKENRPGLEKVISEENTFWVAQTPHKKSELYPSNLAEMRQRVLDNRLNREAQNVIKLFKKYEIEQAKYVVDCYKDHVMYNSSCPQDEYAVLNKLYEELITEYSTQHILKRYNIASSPEIMDLLHEVVPFAAANKPMKVIDHFITILHEKHNDPKYWDAIKPLFDQRGLPIFYDFDEYIFKDITISPLITQPAYLRERSLLLKVSMLASQEDINKLQNHRNVVRYIAKACSSQGLEKELYVGLASAIINALDLKADTTILQCESLILEQPNQMQLKARDNVIKATLRLMEESADLHAKKAPPKFIKDNQSNLTSLNRQFHEMVSFEDYCKINDTMRRISQRLEGKHNRDVPRSNLTKTNFSSNPIVQVTEVKQQNKAILQSNNVTETKPHIAQEKISRRLIAAKSNLLLEINRLKEEKGPAERINQLENLLIKLT